MEELKQLLETLRKEWEQFKQENDKRLKEVAAKGHADPLTEEKIDKHSAAIGALEAQIRELETKANRPGGTTAKEPTPQEQHKAAFAKYLRKGAEDGLEELQQKATVLVDGSNADGGYTVPQDFDRSLYEVALKYSPMRQECNVITVSNEKYERIVNIHGGASGWVAETGARTGQTTPQFGQFKPTFGEAYVNWAASQRVLDDSAFNLEGQITMEAGRMLAILENVEFTGGTGVAGTSPKGFLAYTPSLTPTFGTNINLVKSGTAGTIIADKLLDVPPSILAAYRNGAKWMAAAATFAQVRKLKDGQNRYLWEPSMQAGVPPSLLGFPVVENEDMPAVAASANCIAFGNFKMAMTIADVMGTRLLRDPYTSKPNVIFYITKRTGSGVLDTSALTAYQLAV